MKVEILGVYAVEADEPCHLIEAQIRDHMGDLLMEEFTQEVPGEPRENWQVPMDEYLLDSSGHAGEEAPFPGPIKVDGSVRLAFFFHYLDFESPMLTPVGPVRLPTPSDRPSRLSFLEYEPPY